MNNITTDKGFNGGGKEIIKYAFLGSTTPAESEESFGIENTKPSHLQTMEKEIRREFSEIYMPISVTGKTEKAIKTTSQRITEIIESAICLLDEVLEVFDDEIERVNTFSLFEDMIKSLWELREETNQNFVDVIVFLEVAFKNSHYKSYQKNQYQSIKQVLKKIKTIYVIPQQVKECRQLLIDNGIDLFAPIRNWGDYTIEIKKNIETK